MDLINSIEENFPIKSEIEVVRECDENVLIDKPFGMVVNRAISHKGFTVQDWMEKRHQGIFTKENLEKAKMEIDIIKKKNENILNSVTGEGREEDEIAWDELNYWMFWERNGVVHRLDKETSGILILAKDPDEYVRLLGLFRERKIKKVYRALVHGLIKEDEGVIDSPVGRLPWNRTRFGVLAGGRQAVTRYKVIEKWERVKVAGSDKNEDFSLVELYPETGRTHQLRVHLLSIGHPIVGDQFYVGRKTLRSDEKWCGRMCLRAVKIII